MKRGFTLIEMLVVMGIIAGLLGAGVAAYSSAVRSAQRARGVELVQNLQAALTESLQKKDAWMPALLAEGAGGNGKATKEVGACLAKLGVFSFGRVENDVVELTDVEKLGILSPWGEAAAMSRIAKVGVSDGTKVPSGGTIGDHRLRFAIDDDYDGRTKVSVEGGVPATVRASACVWCCGYDGKFGTKDDIFSWAKDQEVK